ncbi:hypothetical protein DXG03_003373 [Asterophora parasitica]|uniref:Uncharacterized protein n=1 Tax=Asterophora parasitica TaxID=117018 RepID=A0A9P7G512_9AGAR|nr:hypothetical protein DXG03_003373 [Asterophora parasitica]
MPTRARSITPDDDDGRPFKRQRASAPSPSTPSAVKLGSSSSPCPIRVASPLSTATRQLKPLPPATLLLALPALLLSPSSSSQLSLPAINLARHSLRRCLALPALEPREECRAWTGLAELGVLVLDQWEEEERGQTLSEVETALTKALLISQKHPTLAIYTPHLTILSARLAQQHQANPKLAANTLRLLLRNTTTNTPRVLFTAHLALVHSYACAAEHGGKGGGALKKCFAALEDMRAAAPATGTPNLIVLLTLIIRLQLLVRHGQWDDVSRALAEAELHDNIFPESSSESTQPASSSPTQGASCSTPSSCPSHTRLRIHLLILGVLFHTYAGDAREAARRLAVLHAVLDSGCLECSGVEERAIEDFYEGIIEIPFPSPHDTPPLRVYATPPRVLHALAFLVSAAAKKDALGRAPKKGVFAKAGLAELVGSLGALGTAGEAGVIARPVWSFGAGTREHERVRLRMERIRADLLAEVVAISTLRSEFTPAQSTLDTLVAHTRTHGLFPAYAARITLMHAQLAHARGDVERAVRCYKVAGWVASGRGGGEGEEVEKERDEWVRVAARVGEVWVRLGILRRDKRAGDEDNGDLQETRAEDGLRYRQREQEHELEDLRRLGKDVMAECEGLGGTLMAVGEVLRACLGDEFLGAKQHLRRALDLATRAQDNHLRALVLALIASYYHHTARDHAMTMLGTCGQLAAGLGAVAKTQKGATDGTPGVAASGHTRTASGAATPTRTASSAGRQGEAGIGNAPLRLWVGERVVELHRWAGEVQLAERQERVNRRLREVVAGFATSSSPLKT